jgi:vitamin B12 transporter
MNTAGATVRATISPTLAMVAVLVGGERLAQAQTGPAVEGPDEIIVTSSLIAQPRRQLGTAVSAIDIDEIELRGYTDLSDVLRTAPGIAVSNSGGPGKDTALRIRGEDGYRTTLIIDGVRAVDASAPQVSPTFSDILSTNDLQRVEVLRGPQGFIYGADAGGVVNIMTKTGEGGIGGQIGLETGANSLRKIDGAVSGGSDRGDYYLSVTDLSTDGFNATTSDTVLRDDDGADNTTLHAKLGWNVSDNLRLQVVARDVDAETAYDGCFDAATFDRIDDCSATTDQTTYRVSADLSSDVFSNLFAYSYVDVARDNFSAGVSAFRSEGEIGRLEYTGSYRPSDALTLVYGIDLQDEKLVGDPDSFSRDQQGYYFEYEGAFDDRFFLTIGARLDDSEDFGEHTSSRVSAAYVQDIGAGRSLKYRASYGTGFRAPSLYEISYNEGPFSFPPAAGLKLSEETSGGYDVGIEVDGGSGLHVEVTYFDQQIEDEIYFDLDTFSGYLQSPGRSQSTGVEVAAVVPLGERVDLDVNYMHNNAENSTNEQRLRRPKDVANLGIVYRSQNDRFGFIANYRLSRNAVDVGGLALDDYSVLDLSVRYAISDVVEVFGRIQNAADEQYQEVVGYNTAGRSAYAGVRLRF